MIALLPLYGGGALLIREVARRAARGWAAILLLALAYALLEEAFLTQSLFNPDYVGQRLLDYGFIPALGTSLNWTVFVLSIHVVWSIATPILVAEGLAGWRRTQPWLGRAGLAITAVLFLAGCTATAAFSLGNSAFVSGPGQRLVSGVLLVAIVAAAFFLAPPESHASVATRERTAAPTWLVLVVTLALASAFMGAEPFLRSHGAPPLVSLLVRLTCEAAAAWLILGWSARPGWDRRHYAAIAAATTLTYALFGLAAILRGRTNLGVPTNSVDVFGQVVLAAVILGLIAWGARMESGDRS